MLRVHPNLGYDMTATAEAAAFMHKLCDSLLWTDVAAPNEDRVSPRFPAAFLFQMLGSTPQGDAYTAREFEDLGRSAGFENVTREVAATSAEPQSIRADMIVA
jgi:hypothetical protein